MMRAMKRGSIRKRALRGGTCDGPARASILLPLSALASPAFGFVAETPAASGADPGDAAGGAAPTQSNWSGVADDLASVELAANARAAETAEVPPAAASGTGEAPPLPGLPPSARAQEKWPRGYLTLGAGIGTVPSYSGSNNRIAIPAVMVRGRVDGFAFFSRGTNLFVDVLRERKGASVDVKFGPIVNVRTERNARIIDPQVKALGRLPRVMEVGGWAGISKSGVITSAHDSIGLRVSVLADPGKRHGSLVVTPSIEYGTPLSRSTYLGVSVATNFVGKGFGRRYFDIDAAGSAASGLAPYSRAGAKSGFSKYAVSLAMAQSLSGDLRKGWAVAGAAQYGRMLGRYARSPVVETAGRRAQWSFGAGIAYTF